MSDIPEFKPYNPAEPFIKMKLEGSIADRLADAGIPAVRALKYFHDNPEGPASTFFSLLADDFVPFKYTVENDGDWSDYARDALMLALPTHARTKQGRLMVDKKRTAEINEKLKEAAKQDDINKLYMNNRPMSFDSYETLRQMKDSPNHYGISDDLFNVWDDIIVSDKTSGKPLYSMERNPFPTHVYSRNTWADDKPRFPHEDPEYIATRYEPERLHTAYDSRDVTNYNFTAGELDSYDKPTIRDLYRKDYPDNPYGNFGQYDYSLRNKGISGEVYNKLMELGREYEWTVMDETIPYQDKLRKLSEIKNEMEVLETLENLENIE